MLAHGIAGSKALPAGWTANAGILAGDKSPAEWTTLVQIEKLATRTPAVSVDELLKGFYPSPRFG